MPVRHPDRSRTALGQNPDILKLSRSGLFHIYKTILHRMTLYNINRFIILYCMQSLRKILIVCISNPAGAFCFLLFGHVARQCFFFFNRLFFIICSAVSDFFQACFHRKRHLCLQKLSISLQTVHPAFFSINHIRLPVFRKHFYKRFRETLLFFLTDW